MWIIVLIVIIIIIAVKFVNKKEPPAESPENQEPVISPLEVALSEIKPGAFGRAKNIAMYLVSLYDAPYVELGSNMSCASIKKIVTKYIDNQLLFSEEYENHVIDLSGIAETIGKEDNTVYISIGDGRYYHREGTSGDSVKQLIKCYIDAEDMEDDNYKKLILNMRPGTPVTLVGVLGKDKYSGFILQESTLIEVDDIVPDCIMEVAEGIIHEIYDTHD